MGRRGQPPGVRPTREELIRYLRESPRKVGKRELTRYFGLGKDDDAWLSTVLRELSGEGVLDRSSGRRVRKESTLPPVAVLQVISVSPDGDVFAAPAEWKNTLPAPRIMVIPTHTVQAPAVGDRVLARIKTRGDGIFEARPMRVLERAPEEVLGVYEQAGNEGRIRPTNKRMRQEFRVRDADSNGAEPGDVVVVEVASDRHLGMGRAKVKERLEISVQAAKQRATQLRALKID